MRSATLQGVLEHLRKLTDPRRARELCDGDLLERFRRYREEAAFTLLMQRHGAMVLNICRRILGDSHQAEDAFQATFLVLVRKAGTIRKEASWSSWLHVVATHIAHKARAQSARRRACEREALPPGRNDNSFDALAAGELRAALDEEIARLPDKYRTPLVLCYLAEKTHEQAASELGWPKSSVTARLAKARALLLRRLTRRGFTVPAGLLAVLLTESAANAAIPSLLTLSTVRVAMQALNGEASAAASAATLVAGFIRGTTAVKVVGTLTLLAILGFATAVGYRMTAPGLPLSQEATPRAQPAKEQRQAMPERRNHRVDLLGDDLPEEALTRMGSSRLRHPHPRDLFFSADGKSLISFKEGGLRIWDTATGKLLRNLFRLSDFVKDGQVKSCRLVGDSFVRATAKPGEKWLISVQVVDATTGEVRRRVRIKEPAVVVNPTISPDGKRVAVTLQNEIRLYDTTTGDKVQQIPVKGVAAWDIAFSPDSKTIAHNDLSSDTVYLHDVATGKLIREMKRPGDTTLHLVFSPDGRFLASMPQSRVEDKGEVSIWNVHEGKEVQRFTHPFPKAMSGAFSPDGKLVAIGGARAGLVLWDVETGKEIRRLNPHGGVMAIAFSLDGKTLATASPRGAIRLWDTATGKTLPVSADPDMQTADDLRFSADGKRLLGDASACLIWDAATGRELRRISDPKPLDFQHPNDMRFLRLSHDESMLAFANSDGTIILWDVATGKEKRVLKGHDRVVWNLMFAPDSRKLISNGSDGWVRVWDVDNVHQLHQLHGQTPLTVSPNNRYLATGDAKTPAVFVYELSTGRQTNHFDLATEGNVFQLTFSSDSRYLAAAGSPRFGGGMAIAKIWDMTDGQLKGTFESPRTGTVFWSVAISPDGKSVATGNGQGGLLLWELASGRQRHTFVRHESQIVSLAFSPDGKSLAASSVDAPVYVWDVAGSLESQPRRLSKDELQRCWTALAGDDAAAAFQTIRRLAAVSEQTLPFLREHLKPVPAPDLKRVRQLVDLLDSADFPTRQKAAEELENRADTAAGLLRQILAKEKPSLELRRRLQQILESIETKPETLRAVRSVEVLEWIGTPGAVRLLGELAGGAADARLTREAAAAGKRLQH
jgi:RNA polymerase sigma factor (sigma-70 family)